MHHLTHIAQVDLPVDICFRYVDTYENVPKWLFGVSEFTPIGQPERGLGTTVSIAAKIGPVAMRGRGTVCDYIENEFISVRADLGSIDVVISWTFRAHPDGGTEIAADVAYATAPGLAGRMIAKVADRAAGPAMAGSERALRKQLLAIAGP